MKSDPHKYLQKFGGTELYGDFFKSAGEYIINIVKPKSASTSLDQLRYQKYTSKNKNVNLEPTSYLIQGHLECCHYFFDLCYNILSLHHQPGY